MSNGLRRTELFRNLNYQTSFFGITFDDAPFIFLPLVVASGAMIFADMSPFLVLVIAVATVAGLVALKHKKPEGYLWLMLEMIFMPRHLSSKERDRQLDSTLRLPMPNEQRSTTTKVKK
jgi:hypothetical protein